MPKIHPSAIVSEQAELADDVTVGAFTIIDAGVKIGMGCRIGAQAWITGGATMGEGNSVGYGSIIGAEPQSIGFDPETNSSVVIGSNNNIREYVTIHRSIEEGGCTTVEDKNYLMTGVHLAHDVRMGSHNSLANNVLLAGHIKMGDHIFLGGGGGFHQFIHIGSYSIVQGNAVVSLDVPPFCMAHGRNELAGLNVIGLRRGGFTPEERSDIKRAYNLLFRGGDNLTEALAVADERTWTDVAKTLLHSARHASRKGLMQRA
ncbi:MAG TPA: acyl-ACP--UDP-N-acetylglucosamine O-acyltransferase [Verrucomicrobiales bacterium]|jgi:UDP-N-acetylglucosamine acyltransferase|nr:acyl-ACP--UDP-N-acetylglucosamine O-acyltransferase [Verrucomicrobiales bacterium]HCI92579.1 acyl-ACP--UDP-N-acetylglucosamine O-acyltransferase [Verrucomicrobiales bacterium]HCL96641.1 acyl-ACP--UDP-N-acetylglucosamine O-acyltransferase [Verrucomicrobiales bacterium]